MSEFSSEKLVIAAPTEKIFSYLIDFNNFENLMPEQVINWQSTAESCSFTIKGMADLAMRIEKKEPYELISYSSEGKTPFSFQLSFQISAQDDQNSIVDTTLKANLNPMLKMMASRPLQNLVNLLVEKLKHVMEA